MTAPALRMVDVSAVPVYPLDADLRLSHHDFVAFYHRRYLASRFRLLAPPDVRAHALDLWMLSHEQTPAGTLPVDEEELAALARVDLAQWRDLCRRPWSPLYQWTPYRVGNGLRLGHPVVIEVIAQAISQRQAHADRSARGRMAKRIERLPDTMRKAGATVAMAQDKRMVEAVAARLEATVEGYWSVPNVRTAMEWVALNGS